MSEPATTAATEHGTEDADLKRLEKKVKIYGDAAGHVHKHVISPIVALVFVLAVAIMLVQCSAHQKAMQPYNNVIVTPPASTQNAQPSTPVQPQAGSPAAAASVATSSADVSEPASPPATASTSDTSSNDHSPFDPRTLDQCSDSGPVQTLVPGNHVRVKENFTDADGYHGLAQFTVHGPDSGDLFVRHESWANVSDGYIQFRPSGPDAPNAIEVWCHY